MINQLRRIPIDFFFNLSKNGDDLYEVFTWEREVEVEITDWPPTDIGLACPQVRTEHQALKYMAKVFNTFNIKYQS